LDATGIADTWLQREWKAIQALTDEEREFCSATARLGMDPFEFDDTAAELVQSLWQAAPSCVRDELFRASTARCLADSVRWVEAGVEAIQRQTEDGRPWLALRERVEPVVQGGGAPWEQGHGLAQHLRERLAWSDCVPVSLEDLAGAPLPVIDGTQPPVRSLDGVFASSPAHAPCCYTAKRRPESKRYASARGLMAFFYGSPGDPFLLSSAPTGRQQQSRAFAAELLAPAELISGRLAGDEVSREDVADLAAEFEVSTFVIEHQIENHKLARITDS
jgi:hypothetical protein